MTTPAKRFNEFMSREIVPAFRSMGLRGDARGFELPDATCWAIVGFQRDWKDGRMDVTRFTVNLTFAPKAVWELTRAQLDWVGARPSANSSAGFRGVEVLRLGNLLPDGEDRWWTIEDPSQDAAVAEDVATAMRDHGLPWLRSKIHLAIEAARLLD